MNRQERYRLRRLGIARQLAARNAGSLAVLERRERPPTEAERHTFASHLVPGPDGCWLFAGATDGRGYGRVSYRGTTHRAHRLAVWLLGTDELRSLMLRPGAAVVHTCRRRACCNPEHLDVHVPAQQ